MSFSTSRSHILGFRPLTKTPVIWFLSAESRKMKEYLYNGSRLGVWWRHRGECFIDATVQEKDWPSAAAPLWPSAAAPLWPSAAAPLRSGCFQSSPHSTLLINRNLITVRYRIEIQTRFTTPLLEMKWLCEVTFSPVLCLMNCTSFVNLNLHWVTCMPYLNFLAFLVWEIWAWVQSVLNILCVVYIKVLCNSVKRYIEHNKTIHWTQ